jgi:phenylacetic acid degradation operon negative regulatory protein
VTLAALHDELPAQRGGAKALLLTVLGEFVLPAGGAAWTSSLVGAAEVLGIGEKNARQAIARIGDQGLLESRRHGRRVRWSLTPSGRSLLESGTQRIYSFGVSEVDWRGAWLVAHCPVAESKRAVRTQLRTQLGFLGFGELSASLLVSPHVGREAQLRAVLAELGMLDDSVVLRSTLGTAEENASLVTRAWDLDGLSASYTSFEAANASRRPDTPEASFGAMAALVHEWRRFPFVDPELPTELLPDSWAGTAAANTFHECRAAWSPAAQRWFRDLEAGEEPPTRPNR